MNNKHIKFFCFLIFLQLTLAMKVYAQSPVSEEQNTPSARLWLARACVGESGWYGLEDCKATFYVYARRWQTLSQRIDISFEAVVRAYSAPLRPQNRNPNRRQRMIRSLPNSELSGTLARYNLQWIEIRSLVNSWFAGEIQDPCNGLALHFGGAMDRAARHWQRVDCGPNMHNRFYSMRPRSRLVTS